MSEHLNGAMSLTVPPEWLELVAVRAAELVAGQLGVAAARPEPYITVDQAAEYLACPKSRIYSLAAAAGDEIGGGRIPCRREGSRLLLRASELDEWINRGGGIRP